MVKRCCYGTCNSDTRYVDREEGAIVFFPFPKPLSDIEKCHRWIRLCGRPHEQLNLKILQERSKAKHIYVCSKHFIDGKPTTANPDPEPASRYEKVTPARRPPKPRAHSEPPKKKIRTALSETFRYIFTRAYIFVKSNLCLQSLINYLHIYSHSQNQDVVIVHPTVSAFMSEQEDAFHGDCTNSNAQNNGMYKVSCF
ncbi:uncharacterized protein LOC123546666 [Mercenaria mercenaria]|uniref:uncharacterized protein LOC123546666 n=1 Tax=Mercenaria mercenaria TaxID=6596 RepID=UPI00234F64D2|nr:uncharacterized protein LOC123546666 [Mercenaria mercenaria]